MHPVVFVSPHLTCSSGFSSGLGCGATEPRTLQVRKRVAKFKKRAGHETPLALEVRVVIEQKNKQRGGGGGIYGGREEPSAAD